MMYTAEDAIQIYHAKSSTLEFFAAKVPKADWQGIRKEDIEPAQEYYSGDRQVFGLKNFYTQK